jgi:hypothetical protein
MHIQSVVNIGSCKNIPFYAISLSLLNYCIDSFILIYNLYFSSRSLHKLMRF